MMKPIDQLPPALGRTVSPPLGEESFTGLSNAPRMMAGAQALTAPLKEAAGTVAKAGEMEMEAQVSAEERRRAMEFQKILRGGPSYMLQFADEIGRQNPQLGTQLQQEAQGLSPLFQDPKLDGEQAEKILEGFYESAHNRIKNNPQDKTVLETLRHQNKIEFEKVRQQNRLTLEEAKARLYAKYGKGKEKLDYQLTIEEATELLTQTEKAIEIENMVLNDPASTFTEKMSAMKMLAQYNKDKAMATKARWTASQHGAKTPADPNKPPPPPAAAGGKEVASLKEAMGLPDETVFTFKGKKYRKSGKTAVPVK